MDEASQTTLELFIEKAERLAKYVRENDARNSIVVNPGGLMGVFRNAEEEEWQVASTLDGVLVTFRMFVQPGEGMPPVLVALYRVASPVSLVHFKSGGRKPMYAINDGKISSSTDTWDK